MKPNIVIMTSDSPRHAYFAREIAKVIYPTVVVVESKEKLMSSNIDSEFKIFGDIKHREDVVMINKGEINSKEIINMIRSLDIDFGLVFGTSILKKPLINSANSFYINIHTGLTQYYRGVDSCKWAIYNNELDKIGVTIHKIDQGIDTGNILYQDKTKILKGDTCEDIFMRTCKLGADLLCQNLDKIFKHEIPEVKLKKMGRLYRRRDMSEKIDKFLEKNCDIYVNSYLEKRNEK